MKFEGDWNDTLSSQALEVLTNILLFSNGQMAIKETYWFNSIVHESLQVLACW